MIRHLTCSSDTYISKRFIDNKWVYAGNTGNAGTLDLYKLYNQTATRVGNTRVPNTELTRLLLNFDDSWITNARYAGAFDINNASVKATLVLHDAYGGQQVPDNVKIVAYPLSAPFREGIGRDIVYLGDVDNANWLTSSNTTTWYVTGCGLGGPFSDPVDYYTTNANGALEASQTLIEGTEDLVMDVTRHVRDKQFGLLSLTAFRISYTGSLEDDQNSYFVKRFSSRSAYAQEKRPYIKLEWDASIFDDSLQPVIDQDNTCYVSFKKNGIPAYASYLNSNLLGNNCMIMKLSSGSWSASFSASQYSGVEGPVIGQYYSTFAISSLDPVVSFNVNASGSFSTEVSWLTPSNVLLKSDRKLKFTMPSNVPTIDYKRIIVSFYNLNSEYYTDSFMNISIATFDPGSQQIAVVKQPRVSLNVPIKNLHISILNALTGKVIIAPNIIQKSTLTSLNQFEHFWELHTSALPIGGSYVLQAYVYDGKNLIKVGTTSAPFTIKEQQCC